MIDSITIVFREELPVLQLQAQSLSLYCTELKTIYVVVNDDDAVVDQIDCAWWGRLADRVQVIPRSYFGNTWSNNGWLSQQALKMLAASNSKQTWSMVLDAKTLFVKSLPENLFDNNQCHCGTLPIYSVFESSQQITNDLFGINLTQQLGPGGVPFFFHTATVKDMIQHVAQQTETPFAVWFQSHGMLTEFILYSGYVNYRHSGFDALYNSRSKLGGINNLCHSEVSKFDIKYNNMLEDSAMTVSIHRRAWEQLTYAQRHAYRTLLIARGLQVDDLI